MLRHTQSFTLGKDALCSVELRLTVEIFRQLFADVDAEHQRWFTECAVDENAVGSVNTEAVFVERQNSPSVLLSFHLHGFMLRGWNKKQTTCMKYTVHGSGHQNDSKV